MTVDTAETHAGDQKCSCVTDHHPEPDDVDIHHIWPLGQGGPDTPENRRPNCPTTHRNTHILERAWWKAGGPPPWEVRRRFNFYTREQARRAYQSAIAQRLVE